LPLPNGWHWWNCNPVQKHGAVWQIMMFAAGSNGKPSGDFSKLKAST